ncbi:hypothetical protein NCCP133_07270 [Cytobacillus sp. NCCP-133]|nr:hypothetical protein NCCP133_07270 [Cytobacillus sp. NCCP-133]
MGMLGKDQSRTQRRMRVGSESVLLVPELGEEIGGKERKGLIVPGFGEGTREGE